MKTHRLHYGLETQIQIAILHTGCMIASVTIQERGKPIVRFRGNQKQRAEAAAVLRHAGFEPMPEKL